MFVNAIHVWMTFNWFLSFVYTLNIACSVRRCRSVNTSRGFFGEDRCSATTGKSSFRLHPLNGISNTNIEFIQNHIMKSIQLNGL